MGSATARRVRIIAAILSGMTTVIGGPARAALGPSSADLKRLSIEELSGLEISSVSKAPEPISGAPAAAYVITGEDIRRSGATQMAEILRLAPNLQVGRIDAGDYAVSARGFNIGTANKLLVLIDGRTVYTPLYSGVFWDMQNVPPVDIERIEVVSGPGGTLWGSNAVNGVINIVTRNTTQSEGGFVRVSGGNADVNAVAQYGGALGGGGHYRVYAQTMRQGHTLTPAGVDAQDSAALNQGGFRTDWNLDDGNLTFRATSSAASIHPRPAPISICGAAICSDTGNAGLTMSPNSRSRPITITPAGRSATALPTLSTPTICRPSTALPWARTKGSPGAAATASPRTA